MKVVFIEELRNLASVSVRIAGNQMAVRQFVEDRLRSRQQQPGNRNDSSDAFVSIKQVDVSDDLDITLKVAESLHSIPHRRGHGQSNVLSGHPACSRVPLELEQFLNFLALFWIHLFENGLRTLFRQFSKQVRRCAWIHLLDDARNLLGVQRLNKRLLHLRFDLFESLGSDLLVKALK